MDWFERYPMLLVPVIVATMEAWGALKRFVAARRRVGARARGEDSPS